jgi:hypothetical protein
MATERSVELAPVLDAVNGGLIVLDANRVVVSWNAWMASASGHSAKEARGRLLAEIFPRAKLGRLDSAVNATLILGTSTIVTHAINPALLPLQTRSNRPLLHDITVTPVEEPAGRQCLVFVADVTMVTRRERFLRDR